MSLLPPNEGSEYPDWRSMLEAIQSHAKENGYTVTIHHSSTKDGTAYIECDHGGQYQARYELLKTKYFTSEEARNGFITTWKKVVYSSTPDIFEAYWDKLYESYINDFSELISYLWGTWLMPWKRLFVQAYVDQYLHFRNTVTS
ncbi:MAG: hypothetical protein M1839_001444 [Geoglossum umbratile]|nr:MAG: hypothetical protein M1839_001444 [Geoglossum umbratile]